MYAFIQASLEDQELNDIPIAKRCEVLEVSVSGYHAWVKRQRMPVKCKKVISDDTVLKQAKIIRNEMESPKWNWVVGAEFRISIKKPELQGLRP